MNAITGNADDDGYTAPDWCEVELKRFPTAGRGKTADGQDWWFDARHGFWELHIGDLITYLAENGDFCERKPEHEGKYEGCESIRMMVDIVAPLIGKPCEP